MRHWNRTPVIQCAPRNIVFLKNERSSFVNYCFVIYLPIKAHSLKICDQATNLSNASLSVTFFSCRLYIVSAYSVHISLYTTYVQNIFTFYSVHNFLYTIHITYVQKFWSFIFCNNSLYTTMLNVMFPHILYIVYVHNCVHCTI